MTRSSSQIFTPAIVLAVFLFIPTCWGQKEFPTSSPTPPSHEIWTELLQKHVDNEGVVNYRGFIRDRVKLNQYLNKLSTNPPDKDKWTDAEQLAYWINVYNAFTVKLIIDHYPVESIKDIGGRINIPFVNSPWDIKFVDIGGKKIHLNAVEHAIIRVEFDEPRIHFAVNCASYSCPILLNEAYEADKLEEQLERQTVRFMNDERFNIINSPEEAKISRLFRWYSGDFKVDGQNVVDYINRYSDVKLNSNARIRYIDYDWSLNN
ncbi:MAG: DUF547 domain-containing protein [Saprospirales bacterium]|nr:MAG: DUF547 domain-containing protein [Saprospirales bacterium]